MNKVKAHLARFHPQANWTQAMMMSAIEAHEAELARLRAMQPNFHGEPVAVEMPEFLLDTPPADLVDLFDPADTAPESNEKLLVRLREVLGLIGLAEDAGGRAAPELYRRKDRLESGIRWNRGRSAEVI
jgi:hypothetical protein